MKKKLTIITLTTLLITAVIFVSAQQTWNQPIVFGAIVAPLNLPPLCGSSGPNATMTPTPPTETDTGNDPLNPGVISGAFYDLNNPSNVVCGNLADFCDPTQTNTLYETVAGITYGLPYQNYAAIIPHDCSTLGTGYVCNNNFQGQSNLGAYCGPPLPDLIVGAITVVSTVPNAVIQIDVYNAGNGPSTVSTPSSINWHQFPIVGGPGTPYVIPPLGPGQYDTQQLAIIGSSFSSGTLYINGQIDQQNVVTESNENNNYFAYQVTI